MYNGLALDDVKAPITVGNFVSYVNDGFYDGLIFHKITNFPTPTAIIQGGGYDQDLNLITPTYGPIVNESGNGLSNLRGTIAMIGDPINAGSATSQFFINHQDNTNMDEVSYPGDYARAVFGEVTFGLDVVDAIAAVATGTVFSNGGMMIGVPVEDVIINSAYVVAVPEPATICVLGLGGLSLLKRKKK